MMDVNAVLKTNSGKMNFLKGLIRLSKCDGVIDDNELLFFQQAAVAFGLEEGAKEELSSYWENNTSISVEFENTQQRNFFFIQAIQLCWIDGSYTEREKEEIRRLAGELDTPIETIEDVEKWVYEGIVWNEKGNMLLDLA